MDLLPLNLNTPGNRKGMLVSKAKGRVVQIDDAKVQFGRFLTTRDVWLRPHLQKQLQQWAPSVLVDPFAGDGHLIELGRALLGCEAKGFDLHPNGKWVENDSLVQVPSFHDSVILTNPPYLANYSAKRKGVWDGAAKYFDKTDWDDLYLIALDRCLGAADRVMAIIPETFLNSSYPKSRLISFTVLLDNPFEDTDTPVGVACFDGIEKHSDGISLYVGDEVVGSLGSIESKRLAPRLNHAITFNDPLGQIGLRAVDLQDPSKPIRFFHRDDMDYDPANIKVSSRLVTYVRIPGLSEREIVKFVEVANQLLAAFRSGCSDLLLSPFKGNNKLGQRRRRLDYATARALLEFAMDQTHPEQRQSSLFEGFEV